MAYNKLFGTKYAATKTLDIKEIAKLVRADIKAAAELKGFKVTVRISRFSGQIGQSMTCEVKSGPPGFKFLRRSRLYRAAKHLPSPAREEPYLSDEGLAVSNKLEAIMGSYNYDRNELESDYHDQNFFTHVTMPSHAPEMAEFEALMKSDPAATEREAKGEAVHSTLTPPPKPEEFYVGEAEHKRLEAALSPAAMTGVPRWGGDDRECA